MPWDVMAMGRCGAVRAMVRALCQNEACLKKDRGGSQNETPSPLHTAASTKTHLGRVNATK